MLHAQDPSHPQDESATYLWKRSLSFRVLSFFAIFLTTLGVNPLNAAELSVNYSQKNSQTLGLLQPNFGVVLPDAIGGPEGIQVIENSLKASDSWQKDHLNEKTPENTSSIRTYVVQSGDNLSRIAEQFNISVDTIKWENKLNKNTIKIGQELRILPETGIRHTVKKGDTLSGLANKYEVELSKLIDGNGGSLRVGEKIFIKGGSKRSETVKSAPVGTSVQSIARNYSSTKKAASGYYLFPTNGRITSKWGPRGGRFHYGVDIGAPRGTAIVASASGTIVKTITGCREGSRSCGGGYGNYVVIKHGNGTKTLYAHMSKVSVAYGAKVKQGQKIGTIGNTGRSSGPHTHFEIEDLRTGRKIKPSF